MVPKGLEVETCDKPRRTTIDKTNSGVSALLRVAHPSRLFETAEDPGWNPPGGLPGCSTHKHDTLVMMIRDGVRDRLHEKCVGDQDEAHLWDRGGRQKG